MEISEIYSLIFALIIIGVLLGVGFMILGSFQSTTGLPANSVAAINATQNALLQIPNTWLSIIVLVSVASIVITLLVRSFAGQYMGR